MLRRSVLFFEVFENQLVRNIFFLDTVLILDSFSEAQTQKIKKLQHDVKGILSSITDSVDWTAGTVNTAKSLFIMKR